MPLTHLEHPEDTILTGDMSVFDLLYERDSTVTVKMDGCPSIVWGVHPENGRWFVGTKSVFNKKKIKICYELNDIFDLYDIDTHGELIEVLCACFFNLPLSEGVYQGDFIGMGGSDTYLPNTIRYDFPDLVEENIIIAPHTYYTGSILNEMEPHPLEDELISTDKCRFVQPMVDRVVGEGTAPRINVDGIQFLSKKEAAEAKKCINALIRSGHELTDEVLIHILGDERLANLYQMAIEIKWDLMDSMIVYGAPKAYVCGEPINQEGFVMSNKYGMIKLVDRDVFSHANFTQGRFS